LVFFPYIKQAAAEEQDEQCNPIPSEKRIVVFPGIEMTLAQPTCQAIMILNAEFPENLFQSILQAIGLTPAPSSAAKHAVIQRIPPAHIHGLSDLYQKLNSLEPIRGRFIALLNVSEGGHKTAFFYRWFAENIYLSIEVFSFKVEEIMTVSHPGQPDGISSGKSSGVNQAGE